MVTAAKMPIVTALSLLLLAVACRASPYYPLELGYYRYKCPQAEAIVKAVMEQAIWQNPGNGAAVIRMLFHDCFVEGCDASILLDPTPFSPTPEKQSPPNNPSLRGFELIDAIKDAVETACPGVVSCADIIAFAARDASCLLSHGKVSFDMPAGRLDGTFSNASEPLKFLVPPTSNLSDLISSFVAKGLSVEDLVVLSGAHTVGRSHCSSFVPDRLDVPSDIHPGLAGFLKSQCPPNATSGSGNGITSPLQLVGAAPTKRAPGAIRGALPKRAYNCYILRAEVSMTCPISVLFFHLSEPSASSSICKEKAALSKG